MWTHLMSWEEGNLEERPACTVNRGSDKSGNRKLTE